MLVIMCFMYLLYTRYSLNVRILGLVLNLNKKNYLTTIMCIEIIYLSLSLLFIKFSLYLTDPTGQIFVIFILTVSTIESAITIGLLISYFKIKKKLEVKTF